MTPHGFIRDNDSDLKKYKSDFSKQWADIMGGEGFDIIEEGFASDSKALTHDKEPQ